MLDRNSIGDIPLDINYGFARMILSRKETKRLKRIVRDYNAVKKLSPQDYIFLEKTVEILELFQTDERVKEVIRRQKLGMIAAIVTGILLCLVLIALIFTALFGGLPEDVLPIFNIVLPVLVVAFMIWSKEFVIREHFTNLPLHLKIIWWCAFLYNGYNLVNNVFAIVN